MRPEEGESQWEGNTTRPMTREAISKVCWGHICAGARSVALSSVSGGDSICRKATISTLQAANIVDTVESSTAKHHAANSYRHPIRNMNITRRRESIVGNLLWHHDPPGLDELFDGLWRHHGDGCVSLATHLKFLLTREQCPLL